MTPAAILFVLALLPLGSIAWTIGEDMATERELTRHTALPEARESLLPEDWSTSWPRRVTPSDLPARVGLVIAEDGAGRHRAVEPTPEPALVTPTDNFNIVVAKNWTAEEVAALAREWWCQSCLDDHRECVGACACPCTLVEVAAA
jgi:hypothetical protein